MIELRNKQYMTAIDCVAGEAMEVGDVIRLIDNGDGQVRAMKTTAATDAAVQGTTIAHWINPRSETVTYSGGEDGLTFPLAASTDADSQHHIPSGARMVALCGKGVAMVRFFANSLHSSLAVLPAPGTTLSVASTGKLCANGDAAVIASFTNAARVVEKDDVSITVILA
jgi:hypothetical protein